MSFKAVKEIRLKTSSEGFRRQQTDIVVETNAAHQISFFFPFGVFFMEELAYLSKQETQNTFAIYSIKTGKLQRQRESTGDSFQWKNLQHYETKKSGPEL